MWLMHDHATVKGATSTRGRDGHPAAAPPLSLLQPIKNKICVYRCNFVGNICQLHVDESTNFAAIRTRNFSQSVFQFVGKVFVYF